MSEIKRSEMKGLEMKASEIEASKIIRSKIEIDYGLEVGNSYTLDGVYKSNDKIYKNGTVLGTYIKILISCHLAGEEPSFVFESVDGLKNEIELEEYWLGECHNTFILNQVQ